MHLIGTFVNKINSYAYAISCIQQKLSPNFRDKHYFTIYLSKFVFKLEVKKLFANLSHFDVGKF